MNVVHSSIGKYHHFDLARELHSRGYLRQFTTGYPRWKLKHEGLPLHLVKTFPWLMTPFLAATKWQLIRGAIEREWMWQVHETLDRHVARHMQDCVAFIELSSNGLHSGRAIKRRGGLGRLGLLR